MNALDAKPDLPEAFWSGETGMNCLAESVARPARNRLRPPHPAPDGLRQPDAAAGRGPAPGLRLVPPLVRGRLRVGDGPERGGHGDLRRRGADDDQALRGGRALRGPMSDYCRDCRYEPDRAHRRAMRARSRRSTGTSWTQPRSWEKAWCLEPEGSTGRPRGDRRSRPGAARALQGLEPRVVGARRPARSGGRAERRYDAARAGLLLSRTLPTKRDLDCVPVRTNGTTGRRARTLPTRRELECRFVGTNTAAGHRSDPAVVDTSATCTTRAVRPSGRRRLNAGAPLTTPRPRACRVCAQRSALALGENPMRSSTFKGRAPGGGIDRLELSASR